MTVYDDTTGKLLFPAQVVEALAQVASAPVYGPSDTYLGRGVVGGYMDSFELMGASAADLALEILAGRSPSTIDPQPSQIADFSLTSANCCGGNFPKAICPRILSCPSSR